jgi:hypothetical protein
MTVQALALGLSVRQFRAFDREGMAAEFGVARHWEVTTMSAIGRAARTAQGPALADVGHTSPGAPTGHVRPPLA